MNGCVQLFDACPPAVTLGAMRSRIVLLLGAGAALAIPAGAQADLRHVVVPGESLTSVAAADHVSIDALAGANRMTPDARLIAGSVLRIPPPGAGYRTPAAKRSTPRPAPVAPAPRRYTVRPGDTLTGVAARAHVSTAYLARLNHISPTTHIIAGTTLTLPGSAPAPSPPPPAAHSYRVAPGDTLSALALRARLSTVSLARLNHISPTAHIIAGTTLILPGAAAVAPVAPAAHSYQVQPGDTLTAVAARAGVSTAYIARLNHISPAALLIAGATLAVPGPAASGGGPPYPTAQLVTSSQVEQVGVENGVPASLAAAIAWEESGFNNDRVSAADARGVMQILPGTWGWIQNALTSGIPLAPASAIDNVRAGVLYLHALLLATNGDVRLAVAGYVQGLASVRANGMFAVTRQYVGDVLALQQHFGGQ